VSIGPASCRDTLELLHPSAPIAIPAHAIAGAGPTLPIDIFAVR
jgi:hypothetical protein